MIIYQIAAKLRSDARYERNHLMKTSDKARKNRASIDWSAARRLSLADLAAMLWAERMIVLGVGAAICVLGLMLALAAPKSYTARAELLVRLGQEYVYQPTIGGAGAGATPDMENVVNSEMRLLGSGAVVRAAIAKVGLRNLYPDIAAAGGSDTQRIAAAERAFAENLTIETAPRTPAIGLSFKHKNPETAALALNALVDEYLTYRREVLMGGESEGLANQSDELDTRASEASRALAVFLGTHEIGDFESELTSLATRASDVDAQLLDVQTRRGEADARLAALRRQLRSEPAQIELYSESDARRQLVEAQLERETALSRYQEDSAPVREIDRRISQLELFLAGGDHPSLTRRGPNPVHQDVAGQVYSIEAEARAQRGREVALQHQREALRARLRQLQALEPEYRRLQREVTILEQNAGAFATRAEEARAMSQMLGASTDNISQVERAAPPTQGQSLKLPIAIVTIFLAGLAGLVAGLGRGFIRQGFPTPSNAARTLDLPVLAVMPRDARVRRPAKDKMPRPTNDDIEAAPALKLVKGAK